MRILLFVVLLSGIAQAQTLTTLASFGPTDANPNSVIQGADGNFYGTTNDGSIFQLTPAGALTKLYSFSPAATVNPLIQASDGNLYGTTPSVSAFGTVFKITPQGVFSNLYSFCQVMQGLVCPGGNGPNTPLIQATDGNLYGTTSSGGEADGAYGTVFRISTAGAFATLHSFNGQTDGSSATSLIQAADGSFYGTAGGGGTGTCILYGANEGCGTVFQLTPQGKFTPLHNFVSTDGSFPYILIQGADGNFYGITLSGGSGNCPAQQATSPGCGTIFKMTPAGSLTTLYNFPAVNYSPSLMQATNGNLYGTTGTVMIGCTVCDNVFEITPAGVLTTFYTFGPTANGYAPSARSLIQAHDGNLYGTTSYGGTSDNGTVFRLTLPPSDMPAIASTGGILNGASFQPGISAGSWITINGTNLSSKTDTWNNSIVNGALPTTLDGVSVTLGGQPAYIEYVSPTQINAVAPNVAPGSSVSVVVTNANGTSAVVNAQLTAEQPAFFQWGNYAVATRQDFSLAVKNGTFTGATTVPAKPGDVIILWGTGLGPTSPSAPAGAETPSTATYNTATPVTVKIGTQSATVYGAALAPGYAGLYQVAIQIPASLANGDYPVVATINGVASPSTTMITIQQ